MKRNKYSIYSLFDIFLCAIGKEKAYRDYGHDIDGTDTLLEAGLGFTCDFQKKEGFIGMEAVLEQKETAKERGGLQRKMVQVLVQDKEPLLSHGEIIWRNGSRIGDIRAGSYGHTLQGAVGLSLIDAAASRGESDVVNKNFIATGDWEIEIADRTYPIQLSFLPLYDPKGSRVKVIV